MIGFELSADIDAGLVEQAADRYGRRFEGRAAQEAVAIMRANIQVVPRGSRSSTPGGFPVSRTGYLPQSISAEQTNEGYVVGPPFRAPPQNMTLHGASTIAELVNSGGSLTVRRPVRRGGAVVGHKIVRMRIRSRPYIGLTLEILSRRLPEIAANTRFD